LSRLMNDPGASSTHRSDSPALGIGSVTYTAAG
jgi:hypothetical protein